MVQTHIVNITVKCTYICTSVIIIIAPEHVQICQPYKTSLWLSRKGCQLQNS